MRLEYIYINIYVYIHMTPAWCLSSHQFTNELQLKASKKNLTNDRMNHITRTLSKKAEGSPVHPIVWNMYFVLTSPWTIQLRHLRLFVLHLVTSLSLSLHIWVLKLNSVIFREGGADMASHALSAASSIRSCKNLDHALRRSPRRNSATKTRETPHCVVP